MRVWLVVLGTVLALFAGTEKPDFSGRWKLNVEKSDFGGAPGPTSLTSRIEHRGPELKVHSEIAGPQGQYATDYKWFTDGRENVNTVRGNEIHATVVWEGAALKATSTTEANGTKLTLVDQWSLSQDGQVLKIERIIQAPRGNVRQIYLYDKMAGL